MLDDSINEACFADYVAFVHEITGITIDKSRSAMLVGRIRKRVFELGFADYESYLKFVKGDSEEQSCLTNLITTNETYFYRTPRVWDFIENDFLPNHFQKQSKSVRIWSAASSTGDEAYTLGVLCQDFKEANAGFRYKILGTDISSSVVDRATNGVYKGRPVKRFRETREDLFEKYMIGSDEEGYRVSASIKNNIQFKVHNLFNSFVGNGKFDLILLRNVLIYFTQADQEKVLANIHRVLSPGGYLIIGESESLNRTSANFESILPLIYCPKDDVEVEGAA